MCVCLSVYSNLVSCATTCQAINTSDFSVTWAIKRFVKVLKLEHHFLITDRSSLA